MKPSEIELTMSDISVRDRIVDENRPKFEGDILRAAGETMRAERARVVTLIDGLMRKHETAMEAMRRGPKYRECQSAWMTLATAKKFILAGHQEVSK